MHPAYCPDLSPLPVALQVLPLPPLPFSHTSRVGKCERYPTSVDEGVKKKWETAKAEKEATGLLITRYESALEDLTHAIDGATDDLAQGLCSASSFRILLGPHGTSNPASGTKIQRRERERN
jgi:hypothetical protein